MMVLQYSSVENPYLALNKGIVVTHQCRDPTVLCCNTIILIYLVSILFIAGIYTSFLPVALLGTSNENFKSNTTSTLPSVIEM